MGKEDNMAAGRPPKFTSTDKMQEAIDEYFDGAAWVQVGDNNEFRPTISGLAYALDMTTHSLRNYEEKDEFFTTIKKAKLRVEMALEERLYGNSVTGLIFNLKNNFGWKDKLEQELSGPNGGAIQQQVTWTIQPVKPVNESDAET